MNKTNKINSMLLIIFFISSFIISIAINSMLSIIYNDFTLGSMLGKYYVNCSFDHIDDNLPVKVWKKYASFYNVKLIINYADGASCAAINFDDDTIKQLSINAPSLPNNDTDTAIVNASYQNIVTVKTDAKYIRFNGNQYKVAGSFHSRAEFELSDLEYLININSSLLNENTKYASITCISDDPGTLNTLIKTITEKFPAIDIKYSNTIRNNAYTKLSEGLTNIAIILGTGALVFLNCIGFMKAWFDINQSEFGIRLLCGETNFSANMWILRDIFSLLIKSFFASQFLLFLLLIVIERIEWMSYIRYSLSYKYLPASSGMTLLILSTILFIIIEIGFFSIKNKEIMQSIRKRYG